MPALVSELQHRVGSLPLTVSLPNPTQCYSTPAPQAACTTYTLLFEATLLLTKSQHELLCDRLPTFPHFTTFHPFVHVPCSFPLRHIL